MLKRATIINTSYFKSSIPPPGFVKLVDTMPRILSELKIEQLNKSELLLDKAIVQAARVSYGEGMKTREQDAALINYLIKHQHTSPFEMVEFKFHLKMPIYIQRQWIRHRTASVNEISGRYTEFKLDKDSFYHPDSLRQQSKSNKQGSYVNSDLCKTNKDVQNIWNNSKENINQQISNYHKLIKLGVAKEQARMILPVSTYTEFYWKIDLHNLLNFIKLRTHDTAQHEIQLYALNILEMIEKMCPITIEAWKKHVLKEDTNTVKIYSGIKEAFD